MTETTTDVQPSKCTCGAPPIFTSETHGYGGGRYKAKDVSTSWEAKCSKCNYSLYVRYAMMSCEEAVKKWNWDVIERQEKIDHKAARKASPDKLLFDLDHGNLKERALARIIRAVEAAKGKP